MPRGIPKAKNSATPEQARSDKGLNRPKRVPMGIGENLHVPQAIRDEIEAKGCVRRWCLDDGTGGIDQYLAAYWEFYETASGGHFTRPSKGGSQMILMMLDKKLHKEDMASNRARNNASIQSKEQLGDGEYLPDGKEYVVTQEAL